ncbi:MAG: glycosyltransferase [Bifidobacterium sp.]|nr:glycosyltransferase [Bifidobacterium sp.]
MISVIIPLYNQARYVLHCLETLAVQKDADFEAIIVDDGSTDASAQITRGFCRTDHRFRVVSQENAGVSIARNHGLELAKGEWVCFVDPDDAVEPNYLATLLAAAEKHPEADIIMSTCVAVNEEGSEVRQHFFPSSFVARSQEQKARLFRQLMDGAAEQPDGFVTAIGVPWGKLYRRSFLERNNLAFDPELPRMQDNLFNMEVFQAAKEIVYLDYAGYLYRESGLGERTYRNIAKGLYHPAIDKRSRLMRSYGLASDPVLRQAWQTEQVNLYYQELKAVVYLDDGSVWDAWGVARVRGRDLKERVGEVDAGALTKSGKLKYALLTKGPLTGMTGMLLRGRH